MGLATATGWAVSAVPNAVGGEWSVTRHNGFAKFGKPAEGPHWAAAMEGRERGNVPAKGPEHHLATH